MAESNESPPSRSAPSFTTTPESRGDGQPFLSEYFRSGWAFLLPYILLYGFYGAVNGPVQNGPGKSFVSPWHGLPDLLHLYWLLHAANLLLLIVAIAGRKRPLGPRQPFGPRLPLLRLIPWIGLALLFFLPGLYLEFPADPWAHYSRINEWSALSQIRDHSAWAKSSYLIAYSLLGHISPVTSQLRWVNVYSTFGCLLLCWQYFRLARTLGLSAAAAMVFVLLQPLLFGNNLFGFFRYYGISSTLFAQIGVIAACRIAVEKFQGTVRPSRFWPSRPRVALLATASALTVFIGFNHPQGLAIAVLLIGSLTIHRLLRYRRTNFIWIGVGAAVLSIAALRWYPHPPGLFESYRAQGWLSAWFGFNLVDPNSPAWSKAMEILGLAGCINLAAATALLRRNHPAGWLVLGPILALCLPAISLPIATELGRRNPSAIFIFHRLLLGLPSGLALVVVGQQMFTSLTKTRPWKVTAGGFAPFAVLLVVLLLLTVTPPRFPYYNRVWNALERVPSDLAMRGVTALTNPFAATELFDSDTLLASRGTGFVLQATGERTGEARFAYRVLFPPTIPVLEAEDLARRVGALSRPPGNPARLRLSEETALFTPFSTAALLSKHWIPNHLALDQMGQPELKHAALEAGGYERRSGPNTFYFFRSDTTPNMEKPK